MIGRLAIVAGDIQTYTFRDQLALQRVDARQNGFGHFHRIRAGPLGQRQRDSGPGDKGIVARMMLQRPDTRFRFGALHRHCRDIGEIDLASVCAAYFQLLQLCQRLQPVPGLHQQRIAILPRRADGQRRGGLCNGGGQRLQRYTIGSQRLNIRLHAHHQIPPANQRGQADIRHLDQFLLQLICQHAQAGVVPDIAGPVFR